ncbi:hypothetical protein WMY93_032967 [Mugilogobius chulae]|uniref:Muscle-related coiled-coil protein n=1 Tax=Mugilogobius chulae TaxID=88201 RepID=A0AAW0MQ02_9GOBI
MAEKSVDEAGGVMALLERVAALVDGVQAAQTRMEERQTELENTVKSIQSDVIKLTNEHANSSATVTRLLEKTRKVSRHIKDVRVRVETQNVRVKKVEATQGDLLAKNKFRVVIYQGDQELKSVDAGSEPAEAAAAAAAPRRDVEPDKFDLPPESDEEYMVVEEADSSAAARMKKSGLTRIESFKHTFSRENLSKTRDNLGSKVNKLGERIVTAERREKIRQSGEKLKEKLTLKKERTVAEGQEGAAEATAQPVAPPKGRRGTPEAAAAGEGKAEEAEVPIYDMKQLS